MVNAVPSRPIRRSPAARTAAPVASPMCSSGTPRTAVSASAASSSPARAQSPAICSRSISAKSTDRR
jgi:hypothetical protein